MNARGIINWFARHPVAANLLMVFVLVAGGLSAFTIRKEVLPDMDTGTVRVSVDYPGAAPDEVERGICIKVEEAVQGIEGIRRVESTAWEGLGQIAIKIENNADAREVLDRVKNRVDAIDTFPEAAEKPVIEEQVFRHEVMWLILAGDLDEHHLKEVAETVRDELIARDGISQIEIHGVRDAEISIEVSEASLRQYGLTFDEMAEAIRKGSVDFPGGRLKTRGGEILLRSRGKAQSAEEFAGIVLQATANGTRVTVGDVATVIDGFAENDEFVRYQGKPAVAFRILRMGKESTLSVAREVERYLQEKAPGLPPGITLVPVADASQMLRDRLSLMLKNMAFGGLLVFVCLALFLRLRIAFWVMAGLPVCFLGAIWLMPLPPFETSINMITLFGFILVLGIVVDDAIVIAENIHTTVSRKGPGAESVIAGAREVAMPATFGILTTVAAFVPILTIPGTNGKIWSGIAMVVMFCLFFSLVESKLILPAHLLHLTADSAKPKGWLGRLQATVDQGLLRVVKRIYRPLLNLALRHRYTTAALFTALLIVTAGLVKGGIARFVFFPQIEADTIEAVLSMTSGTPPESTRAATARIEQAAETVNARIRQKTGMPQDPIQQLVSVAFTETQVYFYAELLPSEKRDIGSAELVRLWREQTGAIAGVEELKFIGSVADSGSPIDFQLEGRNTDALIAAAEALKARLSTYDGIFDIRDSFRTGQREIRYQVRPAGEAMGVSMADLARWVRYGFHGAKAQTLQRGRHEVDVMVRYPLSERQAVSHLEQMRVRSPQGKTVPFTLLADVEWDRGYAEIHRSDRKRVVNVRADVDKAAMDPNRIIERIREKDLPDILERYPGIHYRMAGESRERAETLGSLKRGSALALLAIFALMAIPLNAYGQPFIIMAAIPFGVVGAIWGHLLVGLPVSVLSLCGIIALSGVVVNDSLVMVDFINRRRAAGAPLADAVREAGAARFRAILLTSLTTFGGLAPMIMEKSLQAQFLVPMSVSLAFGILFATVITLLLIPCLYVIGADLRAYVKKRRFPGAGEQRICLNQRKAGSTYEAVEKKDLRLHEGKSSHSGGGG